MCPPDGGSSSDSIGFILRSGIIYCLLVIASKTPACHVSYIDLDRMTVSVVNCIFNQENIDVVGIEQQ